MKNIKFKALFVILLAGAGLMGWLVQRWIRGTPLPALTDFFDDSALRKALERLPQEPLHRAFLGGVRRHIELAGTVPFSNTGQAAVRLDELRRELRTVQQTWDDLPECAQRLWQPAYTSFLAQTSTALDHAAQLYGALRREDWSSYTLAVLDQALVGCKESASILRDAAYPPWLPHGRTFSRIHHAFTTAYDLRSETDSAKLRAAVFDARYPLIRWQAARRYEQQARLPAALGSTVLLKTADSLERLSQDLRRNGFLADWMFPHRRVAHLKPLADFFVRLEQAASMTEWVALFERQDTPLDAVIRAAQAGGSQPDQDIKTLALAIRDVGYGLLRHSNTYAFDESRRGLARFIAGIAEITNRHQAVRGPAFFLVEQSHDAMLTVAACYDRAVDSEEQPALDPARFKQLFSALKQAAEKLVRLLGRPGLDRRLAGQALEQWMAAHCSGDNADRLRLPLSVFTEHIVIDDPALNQAAQYLPLLLDANAALAHKWPALRERLIQEGYPALADCIGQYTPSLIPRELEALIQARNDLALKQKIDEIKTLPDFHQAPIRALVEAIERMLFFPEYSRRTRIADPGVFLADPSLPQPPEQPLLKPLYVRRIQPVRAYAEHIVALRKAGSRRDEQWQATHYRHIHNAWEARRQASFYFDPQYLDRALAEALAGLSPPCLPLECEQLHHLANMYGIVEIWPDLAAQRPRLQVVAEAARKLAALIVLDPSRPAFADAVTQAFDLIATHKLERPMLTGLKALSQKAIKLEARLHEEGMTFMRLRGAIQADLPSPLPATPGLHDYFRTLHDSLRELEKVVGADVAMVHETDDAQTPQIVIDAYQAYAMDETWHAALRDYARTQAHALGFWLTQTQLVFRLTPAGKKYRDVRIAHAQLGTRLGCGPSRVGSGDGLNVQVGADTLCIADWYEHATKWPEHVLLDDIETHTVTSAWTWAEPIAFAVSVYHGTNTSRNWSQWYNEQGLATQRYVLARFANIEQLVRKSGWQPSGWTPFDPILTGRDVALSNAGVRLYIRDLPPQRDLDWPDWFQYKPAADAPNRKKEAEIIGNVLSNRMRHWLQLDE